MTEISLITMEEMRKSLYSAVVADALDSLGFTEQSPRVPLTPYSQEGVLVGRCKTTLWADLYHADPDTYEKELQAVDECSALNSSAACLQAAQVLHPTPPIPSSRRTALSDGCRAVVHR